MIYIGHTPRTGAHYVADCEIARGTPRATWLVLGAVTALGAVLRLHGIGAWGVWYDEANTLYAATLTATPGALLDARTMMDAPLFSMLVWGWRHVLGWTPLMPGAEGYDAALRLLPWFFSVLAIPMTFAVARRLLGDDVPAIIAAALMALSPFQVYYAQELRNYSLHLVLMLGALAFAVRAMQCNRVVDWAGLTGCLALGVGNHFYALWYMIFFSMAFVATMPWHGTRRLAGWTAANAAAVILAAPVIHMAFGVSAIMEGITSPWYPDVTWKTGLLTFKAFFTGYTPRSWVYWPLFLSAAGLCGAGTLRLRKRPQPLLWIVILSFGAILVSLVFWSSRGFSSYQHRLFIFSGATASMLLAQGVACVRWRPARGALIAAWIALTIPALGDLYAQRLHPLEPHRLGVRYRVENRAAATLIRETAAPGERVVHCSHVTMPSFRYYTGPGLTHLHAAFTEADIQGFLGSLPSADLWEQMDLMPVRLEEAVRGATGVWYVESWWEPFDPPRHYALYREFLDHHFLLTEQHTFFGVTVYRYDADPERSRVARRYRLADDGDGGRAAWRLPEGPVFEPVRTRSPRVRTATPAKWSLSLTEGDAGALPALVAATADSVAATAGMVNPGPARAVAVEGFVSAARIDAPAFWRETPARDTWSAAEQFDPARNAPRAAPSLVARLSADESPTAVYADTEVPGGEFDVYARVLHVNEPVNTSRGALHAAIETSEGRWEAEGLVPSDPAIPAGWVWRRLGRVTIEGGPCRVWVTASNPGRFGEAYLDLAAVAFVPAAVAAGADPLAPAWVDRLRVDAGQAVRAEWTAAWPAGMPARVDITAEDPSDGDWRHVFADAVPLTYPQ